MTLPKSFLQQTGFTPPNFFWFFSPEQLTTTLNNFNPTIFYFLRGWGSSNAPPGLNLENIFLTNIVLTNNLNQQISDFEQ